MHTLYNFLKLQDAGQGGGTHFTPDPLHLITVNNGENMQKGKETGFSPLITPLLAHKILESSCGTVKTLTSQAHYPWYKLTQVLQRTDGLREWRRFD